LLCPSGNRTTRRTAGGCDNIIADHVANATAGKLQSEFPVLVLRLFPTATIRKPFKTGPACSCSLAVIIDYLSDICTSAVEMGFRKLIIISTHGPHGMWPVSRLAMFSTAQRRRRGQHPHSIIGRQYAKMRKSKIGGTSHACEYETSLLMHFGYAIDLTVWMTGIT